MKLSDFTITPESENDAAYDVIAEFNKTSRAYPSDSTIHAEFAKQVEKSPEAIALQYGDNKFTYSDIDKASNQLASFLIENGLKPEAIVAVLVDKTFEMVVSLIGILKAGGAYLPLSENMPVNQLAYLVNDTGAKHILFEHRNLEKMSALKAECVSLNLFLCVDQDSLQAKESEIGAALHGVSSVQQSSDASVESVGNAQSLAYVMYTSGTSGKPKGVLIEHRSVLRLAINNGFIEVKSDDCLLQTGSLAFDASTFELWGILLNGAKLCRPSQHAILDSAELGRVIQENGVSIMWITASLCNQLIDTDASIFKPMRVLMAGGERLSPKHMNEVRKVCPNLSLINGYGPTENTTFTTCHSIETNYEEDIPIGKPIGNTTVWILDEKMNCLPTGVIGEIYTGGDGLFREYLNDSDLTKSKLLDDPMHPGQKLYRTGDLGRWRNDGTIEYHGRKDTQVKLRGYRIELAEIESRLNSYEDIKEVAVLVQSSVEGAAKHDSESDELVAYYVSDDEIRQDDCRKYLQEWLPDYMVPTHFVQIDAIPLTTNGKRDLRSLPTLRGKIDITTGKGEINTELESALVSIWEDVLGEEGIGAEDDFFDIGGHSLKVAKVTVLIEKRLGINIPMNALFKATTIRELARLVSKQASFGVSEADEMIVEFNSSAKGGTVYAFPPGTGDALSYVQLARELKDHRICALNFVEFDNPVRDIAKAIAAHKDSEPLTLIGYSYGGNMAYHVAEELSKLGVEVADVIMIDSGRTIKAIKFPSDEVRKIASEFLNHEHVKDVVSSVALREKAIDRIRRYYQLIESNTDMHQINANIHLLYCSDTPDKHLDENGEVIVDNFAWQDCTNGKFKKYIAKGTHNTMLYPPFVQENASIIHKIMKG